MSEEDKKLLDLLKDLTSDQKDAFEKEIDELIKKTGTVN